MSLPSDGFRAPRPFHFLPHTVATRGRARACVCGASCGVQYLSTRVPVRVPGYAFSKMVREAIICNLHYRFSLSLEKYVICCISLDPLYA